MHAKIGMIGARPGKIDRLVEFVPSMLSFPAAAAVPACAPC